MLKRIWLWWLRRREAALQERVARAHDDRLYYAEQAYQIDQMAQPMAWARAQNSCNWAGLAWRQGMKQLGDVRAAIERGEARA